MPRRTHTERRIPSYPNAAFYHFQQQQQGIGFSSTDLLMKLPGHSSQGADTLGGSNIRNTAFTTGIKALLHTSRALNHIYGTWQPELRAIGKGALGLSAPIQGKSTFFYEKYLNSQHSRLAATYTKNCQKLNSWGQHDHFFTSSEASGLVPKLRHRILPPPKTSRPAQTLSFSYSPAMALPAS
ncbi:hypothetical protein Anapl_00054 [Anas platyrhynchos]|uniref:Uncharacterized protein n=1 Tax=Anas platyrhynchos TaxID=8839 RepID=R0LTU8_ANAPL|nr:hypothetical protein Anapl_00054 [Anas platyrhynchos]